ncbi:hypothetical protein MMC13_005452 [Lambiella insularis]|nr:hypothetical protein [Lambiella insularis]
MSSSSHLPEDTPAHNTRFGHLKRPSSFENVRASSATRREVNQESPQAAPSSSPRSVPKFLPIRETPQAGPSSRREVEQEASQADPSFSPSSPSFSGSDDSDIETDDLDIKVDTSEDDCQAALNQQIEENLMLDILEASTRLMSSTRDREVPSVPLLPENLPLRPLAPSSTPSPLPPTRSVPRPEAVPIAHLLSLLRMDNAMSPFFSPNLTTFPGSWVRNGYMVQPQDKLGYVRFVISGACSYIKQHNQDIDELGSCLQGVQNGSNPITDVFMPKFKEIWRTTCVDLETAMHTLAALVAPFYPAYREGLKRAEMSLLLELAEKRIHFLTHEKSLISRQLYLCGVKEPETVRREMAFIPLRPLTHRNSPSHVVALMPRICALHDISDDKLENYVPTEAEVAYQRRAQDIPIESVEREDRFQDHQRVEAERTARWVESCRPWDPYDIAYDTTLMAMERGR